MKSCTFYGHASIPEDLKPVLKEKIRKLITEYNVTQFYIGDKGGFDLMVIKCVSELKEEYPRIDFSVVLSYIPGKKTLWNESLPNTVYPDGLEKVPPKFAILRRNQIMAENSDYAIVYIHRFGGAATAAEYADKKGVKIINISTERGSEYFEYNNAFSF